MGTDFENSLNNIHLMYGPEGNSFVFPRVLMHTAASIVQSLPSELGIQEQLISTSAPWPNATSVSSSSVSKHLK